MKKSAKISTLFVTMLLLGTFSPLMASTTVSAATIEQPAIEAAAAFAIEPTTGKVLLNQNGDEKLGIASMTKMITEYILLETIKNGDLAWDDQVNISEYAHNISQNYELSNVPLRIDDTYSVEELYQAMAIYSANGATIALAEHIAGDEKSFVDMMHEKVESWGITNYELYNTTGLSNSDLQGNIYPGSTEDSENSMTAREMSIVAQRLLVDFPEVLKTSSISEKKFREGTSDEISMQNFNWMLPGLIYERENVDGLKTGTTDFAGASMTGTAEEEGMRVITIVMNATNGQENLSKRFAETDKIMDWAFENWDMVPVFKEGQTLEDVEPLAVDKGKEDTLNVAVQSDVSLLVPTNADSEKTTATVQVKKDLLNEAGNLTAPIKKGTEVGTAQVISEGDELGYVNGDKGEEVTVVAASTVEKSNVFVLAGRWVKAFISNLF
ncbi:D-alanyl-D-alanine carboxypeptidase DacA [Carnobacterium sp. 17-4]|uniref:serine hydrolase n=1 Tax=Carnobacterium sp. (strain 17-4) TaxID=208596 RepID=UPI000205874E|nr:serine hydrolase [Carnobacterium sp. 17-4]AEB31142.1 D-alanyl-D-alanine carboxypeptidase DacA [Carnobacterium sp. 17-4]